MKVESTGNVNTELKSEFSSQGINQTLHRIYIEVNCEANVYTSFYHTKENTSIQVLLAEAVIVGNIPEAYYQFHGTGEDTALQMVNEKESR